MGNNSDLNQMIQWDPKWVQPQLFSYPATVVQMPLSDTDRELIDLKVRVAEIRGLLTFAFVAPPLDNERLTNLLTIVLDKLKEAEK